MTAKIRLNVFLPKETADRVDRLAVRLGVTKTMVGSLAIQTGLDAVELALNPEWKVYFETMMKEGKTPKLSYVEMDCDGEDCDDEETNRGSGIVQDQEKKE